MPPAGGGQERGVWDTCESEHRSRKEHKAEYWDQVQGSALARMTVTLGRSPDPLGTRLLSLRRGL